MIKKFNNFKLNEELDFDIKPTEYSILKISPLFVGKEDMIYRFVSKSGESYDIYFSLTKESNHILSNGENIDKYTKSFIPTIFFAPTERGLETSIFDKLTNKNEMLEVMGKVIYLINEYDKVNNFSVYSIGEVDKKKYKFYSYFLHNIPQFKI
jgi:hypothetical protein